VIIFRYLIKEVAKTQLAVFLVLMTIFISQKFVRVLADASEGSLPGEMVMTFIALKTPELVSIMLPLSLFLGILLAYGRIYADSEMTVLHACGVSEWFVIRLTLVLALVTAIITAIFTVYLAPLAAEYEYRAKEEIAADAGLSNLVAGRFQQTNNENAVVFIHDKNRQTNELEKVFVAQLPGENSSEKEIRSASIVYSAKGKVIEEANGSQSLVLEDGNRYEYDIEQKSYQSVEFGSYNIQIQDKEVEHKRRKFSALPIEQLIALDQPEAKAQVHWRIGFPISVLILTLIAVPLSVVNPRQGKFAKMFPALLLYLGYYLLMVSGVKAVEKEIFSGSVGLWPIHISALIIAFAFVMQNRTITKEVKAKLRGRTV
jgi:lipopolysaccharide export system permease protein